MTTHTLISASELQRIEARIKTLQPGSLPARGLELSGPQLTPYRGAGMELQDLRGYQAGDDVRHIAWRSSARTGRPMIKVFQAERQARRLLVVEQHGGMYFASRGELKAALAVRICALLGFGALHRQSEVGALTFTEEEHFFPYSRRQRQTLALLGSINRARCQAAAADPNSVIDQIRRLAQRRTEVYLISDFGHWRAEHLRTLGSLGQDYPLHAIQIFDQGERELTNLGRLRVASPYDGSLHLIDTRDPRLRARYNEQMAAHQKMVEEEFRRAAIRHTACATHEDPLPTLGPLL